MVIAVVGLHFVDQRVLYWQGGVTEGARCDARQKFFFSAATDGKDSKIN